MKMASFKMYFTAAVALILGSLFSTEAQSLVPVLLWQSRNVGESDSSPAALSKMNVEEFGDVLMRRVNHDPMIVLFVENRLSVEDFSKQVSGASSSFPALKSIKGDVRLDFIPAVQTPAKALNRLSTKLGYKWEQLSGEVLPEPGKKIIVVNLGDVEEDEDRSTMLLRHDKYIASMFKRMVAKYSDILVVYTGRQSSWTEPETHDRVRRDAEPTSAAAPSCNVVLSSIGNADQVLLHTSECPVLTVNKVVYNLTSGEAQKGDSRKGFARMVVRYKVESSIDMATVRFRFNYTDNGYWELTQAEVEKDKVRETLDSKSNIRAPLNSSYSCGSEALFQNADGTVTLRLKNIKVQPGVQGGVFSPANDCIPFFTIPIWSGLFVTFLLLFIVAWGIDMMMNIHTMDRFDDPKGKPLTFNAQE
ncbi:hypothetical protein ONE63_010000 [Megalurothrips usitatus]|uniref:V-type proton ATPase subunit S1 n=1 Tax=Megalurothrips usitatus TaxID=439358 RepID=A0AAV7XMZ9_9NEOP|nr:hypothetical protein ONE63_010000 [Megalurothrips usitatus]